MPLDFGKNMTELIDLITVEDFKKQFPRFSPMYLPVFIQGNTYFKDDVVYFNNLFYICIVESTTDDPTNAENWKLINQSVLNYTQDNDIEEAFQEAYVNFNEGLFPDIETAKRVFLFLTAHYLTVDFNNALGVNNLGIPTSKSVGSVSEGYTIPQWLTNSPGLSMYSTTGYGVKYASLIRPYLVGNIFIARGATTVE